MQLSSFYNVGIGALEDPKASKVKISNIVTIITSLVASLYALLFYIQIQQPKLALMNLVFVAAYALSLAFNYFHLHKAAKLWLFMVLMVHVFVLTVYVFTASASFHFYYLLLPCGVFMLFDDEDETEKFLVMVAGSALFFYCHIFQNTDPLVVLPKHTEQIIFISAITVIILEIYLVMTIFSRANAKHQQTLQELATIDPLTGVNNRRTMITRGEEFYQYAKRYKTDFSLLILDVDHFKKVNDTYGHSIGDDVLKQVSQTLIDSTRTTDFVARFGGEEFVVLLPETDSKTAFTIAEQLRIKISNNEVITSMGSIKCTASFGVATFDGSSDSIVRDEENSFSNLLTNADTALYDSKNNGRNKVSAYAHQLKSAV